MSHLSAIISAEMPWLTRLYFSSSSGEYAQPYSPITAAASAKEMCPIDSTPPATTMSWTPEAIIAEAKLIDCWADPHCRSMVVAGVSIGKPASSQALRPMLRLCSPNCWTQPATTSFTCPASMPVRLTSSV